MKKLIALMAMTAITATAGNWEKLELLPSETNMYRHVVIISVEPQPQDTLPLGEIAWPTVETVAEDIDGEPITSTSPARYAKYVNGALVACTDADITAHEANVAAAAQAAYAQDIATKAHAHGGKVMLLKGLLAQYGLTIPTTEADAMAAIETMAIAGTLTDAQISLMGTLSAVWASVVTAKVQDDLEAIVAAVEATQGGGE